MGNPSDSLECQICLSALEKREDATILPCVHCFCHDCAIRFLLRKEFTCPSCRQAFDITEFRDPYLVEYCRTLTHTAACFRCERRVDEPEAKFCVDCFAVLCPDCWGQEGTEETVSKTATFQHSTSHAFLPWTLELGVKLNYQVWEKIREKMLIAEAEEPGRTGKILNMFRERLYPKVTQNLTDSLKEVYFTKGPIELEKKIVNYCKNTNERLEDYQKVLRIFYNISTGDEVFEECKWNRIEFSEKKLNLLTRNLLGFADPKWETSLKELLWTLDPENLDVSHWNRIGDYSDDLFETFAKCILMVSKTSLPGLTPFLYSKELMESIQTEAAKRQAAMEKEEAELYSRFLCFRTKKKASRPKSSFKIRSSEMENASENGDEIAPRNSTISKTVETADGISLQDPREDFAPGPEEEDTLNEDGEPLKFANPEPETFGTGLGVCEPGTFPDGRVFAPTRCTGVIIMSPTLEFLEFKEPRVFYADLKYCEARNVLVGLVSPDYFKEAEQHFDSDNSDSPCLLKVLDKDFKTLALWELPEALKRVRTMAVCETGVYILQTKGIYFVEWSEILPNNNASLKKTKKTSPKRKVPLKKKQKNPPIASSRKGSSGLETKEFSGTYRTVVEDRSENVVIQLMIEHKGSLYVTSETDSEILKINGETGEITKRIRSKKFHRPTDPVGICKDEFGNLIVTDTQGIVVFDLETGHFKGALAGAPGLNCEITARNGHVYVNTELPKLIRIQYLKPEAQNKGPSPIETEEEAKMYQGEMEPEDKPQTSSA